jgi:hypothetical protein
MYRYVSDENGRQEKKTTLYRRNSLWLIKIGAIIPTQHTTRSDFAHGHGAQDAFLDIYFRKAFRKQSDAVVELGRQQDIPNLSKDSHTCK